MANQRNLKAFVRYDGSGRVVAGSLILRKNKPKVGNWQEILGYKCCNLNQTPIVVDVQTSFPFTYPDFVVRSNDGVYTYIYSAGDNTSVANLAELAAYNNSRYSGLGKFSVLDGDLMFTPSASTTAIFTAAGVTSILAYSYTGD